MLELGADPTIRCHQGFDALGLACYHQNADAVQLILKHNEIDVNAIYSNGETPLLIALKSGISWQCSSANIIRWLLEKGANPNRTSRLFHTALHTVVDRCSEHDLSGLNILDLLLAHGANRHVLTPDGKNALSLAASRQLDSVCRRLLTFGDLPYDDSPTQKQALLTTICWMIIYGRLDLLKLMFEANYAPEIRRLVHEFQSKLPTQGDVKCKQYVANQIELAGQPLTLQQITRLKLRCLLRDKLDDFVYDFHFPRPIASFLLLQNID